MFNFFNKTQESLVEKAVGWNYKQAGYGNLKKASKQELVTYFRSTIYAACKKEANKISQVHFRLYAPQKGSGKGTKALKPYEVDRLFNQTCAKSIANTYDLSEVYSHPALNAIRNPNPYLTSRQYSKYRELYRLTTGVVYHHFIDPYFYILPSHRVECIEDKKDGTPKSYRFGSIELPASEVLVEVSENLENPYGGSAGTSPVQAVLSSLVLQDDITAKLISILRAPKVGGVLSPRGEYSELSDDSAQLWRKLADEFKRSRENDILILPAEARFEPLSQSPTDLAAIEIMKAMEKEIAKVFGIPYMVLLGSEGTSRATYLAAVQEWIDSSISYRLRELEDFYNYKVLPLFPNTEGMFVAADDPSPRNENEEITKYVTACGGPFLEVNEARASLGWEPKDGGDTIRNLETGFDFVGGMAEPSPEEAPAAATVADETQEIQTLPENTLNGAQIAGATGIVAAVSAGQLPRDAGIGQLQTLVNLTPEQAEACMGSVGQSFFAPGVEPVKAACACCTKRIEKAKRNTPPEGKQLLPILRKHFARLHSKVRQTVKSISVVEEKGVIVCKDLPQRFIPSNEWSKDLAIDSQPILELIAEERGKKLLGRVGASDSVYNVFNKEVSTFARKAALEFAESTLKTTTRTVNDALAATREAIASGSEAGESISELADRIDEIFTGLERHQSVAIAKTESARAFHNGLREAATASGVVSGLEHVTSSDPCPECEELNGKIYSLTDDLPPIHTNCVCALVEILDEDQLDKPEEETEETTEADSEDEES